MQRDDQLGEPGFHVERAGAVNHVAVDAERTLGERADRPDRVEMTDDELRRPATLTLRRSRIDMARRPRRSGFARVEADAREGQPQDAAHIVVGLGVVGRRFSLDQVARQAR